jgi:S1-C subfamily serine protease
MKGIILIILSFFTLGVFAQSTTWNQYKLKQHWKENPADEIEGIYIKSRKIVQYNGFGNPKTQKFVSGEDFFILKQDDKYILASFSNDFHGTMTKVVGSNKYFLTTNLKYWISDENERKTLSMYLNSSKELVLEDVVYILNKSASGVDYTNKAVINDRFSLVYKPEKAKKTESKKVSSSGTGFAISSDGIIVTNFHVIENAKTIIIKGVNSDFNKTYKAKVLVSDKNNDLALIQIDDYNFTSLGTIPYTLKTKLSNVGEDIFALGYPLRAIMGDEIKLTNGIISSKTGFQGDITSYQVSAPVQPGNSGGPLFDGNGNIIGIINAKLIIAENASYAVKASYLLNLIELLNSSPKSPTINTLKGKSLATQVQIINKFVYIIETE